MRTCLFLIGLLLSTTALPSYAEEMWKWDGDGASKLLLLDERCQCYFSMSFPEKVTPQPNSHFLLQKFPAQLVTLPKSDFLPNGASIKDVETVLRRHMKYELAYLEKVAGAKNVNLNRVEWNSGSKYLQWQAQRISKEAPSTIATVAVVSGECVVFASSVVPDGATAEHITQSLIKILTSIKQHRPISQEEAEKLIAEYAKS